MRPVPLQSGQGPDSISPVPPQLLQICTSFTFLLFPASPRLPRSRVVYGLLLVSAYLTAIEGVEPSTSGTRLAVRRAEALNY